MSIFVYMKQSIKWNKALVYDGYMLSTYVYKDVWKATPNRKTKTKKIKKKPTKFSREELYSKKIKNKEKKEYSWAAAAVKKDLFFTFMPFFYF